MVSHPRLRTDLILREVEDELLLYDPDNGETLLLNPTAAAIAELCDGQLGPDAITDEILAAIEVERDAVRGDVDKVLAELDIKGFLEATK